MNLFAIQNHFSRPLFLERIDFSCDLLETRQERGAGIVNVDRNARRGPLLCRLLHSGSRFSIRSGGAADKESGM